MHQLALKLGFPQDCDFQLSNQIVHASRNECQVSELVEEEVFSRESKLLMVAIMTRLKTLNSDFDNFAVRFHEARSWPLQQLK